MITKSYIYIPVFLILLVLVFWIGMNKRRDLPFQEVIPLDQRIAVVNAGKWYNDSMSVALIENGGKKQVKKYNRDGICIFDNLKNNVKYTVKIHRTDVKGILLYKAKKDIIEPKAGNAKYIVLVGASVGKSWNFPRLTKRIGTDKNVVLGFRAIYDFDKSPEIKILASNPDIVSSVIIKECAAYFPRDLGKSKKDIISWVEKLQSAGIQPILATVVPVTEELDKNAPGKFDSILKYNDFIRKFSADKNLALLDLEKALRISSNNRHLKDTYAKIDGYHLNPSAYKQALDILGKSFLANM